MPRPLIAVVDDDEIIRTAVGRLLRTANFHVETFPSGADFLESLQSHRPDCVILDIAMPQIDGLAVQARLTQDGIQLPIVVLTGEESATSRTCALAGGASAYLEKSVSRQTLLNAITTAISHPPETLGPLEETQPH